MSKHVALDWNLPIWNSRSFLILIFRVTGVLRLYMFIINEYTRLLANHSHSFPVFTRNIVNSLGLLFKYREVHGQCENQTEARDAMICNQGLIVSAMQTEIAFRRHYLAHQSRTRDISGQRVFGQQRDSLPRVRVVKELRVFYIRCLTLEYFMSLFCGFALYFKLAEW